MKKKIDDVLFLSQACLLVFLIAFYILSLFIGELEILYKIILVPLFVLIGYNSRERTSRKIQYLYYFISFCILLGIVFGLING